MGGWCTRRDQCVDYHRRGDVVSERLCERGKEDPSPMRDMRFDAWLAGATAEQQARWERLQQQGATKVNDNDLPPALRGGALEVF